MRSASWGAILRDFPRSCRGWGASASKPPLRYRLTQSSNVSTETEVRWDPGIS